MKNKILFVIVLFTSNLYAQTCLPGGITFQFQSEINAFPSLYPLCTTIEGDVTIDASTQFSIFNLDSLYTIESIQGNLKIHTNNISDLEGLQALTSIAGQLTISYNNNLQNLTGLNALSNIGADFIITNNNKLVNLIGLENLNSIGGDFVVTDNDDFITPQALNNLEQIGGNLHIESDFAQQIVGLENLRFIGGDFIHSDGFTPKLINFDGFENLDTIIGSLVIQSSFYLENLLGFDNLKYIGGHLDLSFTDDLDSLTTSEFPILNTVGGNLRFNFGDFKTIDGFNNLEKIGGELSIFDLTPLTEVSGFESLTRVDSFIYIEKCNYLVSIPDFNNLTHVGGILIGDPENLSADGNNILSSIVGFENLLTVEKDLLIGKNNYLELIDGFNAVISVGGDVGIVDNGFSGPDSIRVLNAIQEIGGDFLLNRLAYSYNTEFNFLTHVGGDLLIGGNVAPTLSLPVLERVEGSLIIDGSGQLTNISGLTNVDYIGGDFIVNEAFGLKQLNTFYILDSIGGDFFITDNFNLRTVSGFDQLVYIGGHLLIDENNNFSDTSLTHIPSFNSLVHIGGSLSITSNDHLISINGFNSLLHAYNIGILYNTDMEEISGFNSLKKVNGGLRLVNAPIFEAFPQLDSIVEHFEFNGSTHFVGFENLNYVGSSVQLKNLHIKAANQFSQLNHIGGALTTDLLTVDNNVGLLNEVLYVGGIIEINRITGQTLNLLEKIDGVNGRLHIEENNLVTLNGFNTIKQITEGFYLMDNDELSDINGFNNLTTIGDRFTCSGNPRSFNFEFLNQLSSIGNNTIFANNDSIFTLDGLHNLKHINGSLSINDHFRLLDISALSNLESINGALVLADNRKLKSLIGLQNIDPLSIKSTSGNPNADDLLLESNDSLSVCNIKSICEYLRLPDNQSSIHLNMEGCDFPQEIMCTSWGLAGEVFYDNNQNGIKDNNDYGIENRSIQLQPENKTLYTNENGQYYEVVDSGTVYTLNYIENPDWILTSDSLSYTHTFVPGQPENLINNFGVYPTFSEHNGEISLISNPTRCNTEVNFYLKMKNEGTFFERGDLSLQIDSKCEFVEAFPPPNIINPSGLILTWSRDSIAPFQAFEPLVILAMPDETFTGDTISFSSNWNSINSGLSVYNNYESEVRCAYDPNDKLAMPAGVYDENYALLTDTFEYTIRFQNTGNDVAIDVSIFDTISTQFDIAGFKVLNSSHPVQVRRKDHAVEFFFNEIYLPDSLLNEPGSHGFVSYRVTSREDTPNNSIVENTAHIVFDFNPPIVTNTTSHTLVDSIPVFTSIKDAAPFALSIQPNPTAGRFNIIGLERFLNKKFIIYNAYGQIIQNSEGGSFDLSQHAPGMYWIKAILDDKIFTLNVLLSRY